MLCVYFFFRLVPKEKDTKKKGTPATSPVLLRHCQAQVRGDLSERSEFEIFSNGFS